MRADDRDRPQHVAEPGQRPPGRQGPGIGDEDVERVGLPEARERERGPRDDEDPADRVPRTLVHDHDAEDRHAEVHEHVDDVGGAPDRDVVRQVAPAIDEHQHERGEQQRRSSRSRRTRPTCERSTWSCPHLAPDCGLTDDRCGRGPRMRSCPVSPSGRSDYPSLRMPAPSRGGPSGLDRGAPSPSGARTASRDP